MVFLTFGEAGKNFDWIFCIIRIVEIHVEKAARFAKSETREYRGDCLVLILVTNKYLVFKIPHYASLYKYTLWMR